MPQPPHSPHDDPNTTPESKEEQVESFLKAFTATYGQKVKAETYGSFRITSWDNPSQDIARVRLSDYSPLLLDDTDEERLQRLQKIIADIDQKIIAEPPPSTDTRRYQIDYRNSLNSGQYLAATTLKGPVLVIAGAGSGKTRTVIYRLSYMLENGIPPSEILLLTFTRKAAQEMVRRAQGLLGNPTAVGGITATTYHSFANTVLRAYAPMIGLPPNFTIIDSIDAEDSIDLIRSELKLNKQNKAFPKKDRIAEIISKSRNCGLRIADVVEREFKGLTEYIADLELVASTYKKYKLHNRILDYDDLMDLLRYALRENLPFRRALQQQFKYIMIDEFQDTNIVQKQIIDYLSEQSRNIMVVGDDAQSIYAFRGANFENILTFPATYPDCKVVKLEQNYRSNQHLLDFTNNIANNALLGYKKHLFSETHTPFIPIIAKFRDQQEEASFVVDKILALREKNIPLNQIAVLYRSSYHSNYIQTELLKRSIPYVMIGGIKFVERRQIKDLMAFLRLLLNPVDAVSWNRILKLIPGIGTVTARKIVQAVQAQEGKFDFSKFEKNKFGHELDRLALILNTAADPSVSVPTKIEIVKRYYAPLLQTLETDYELRLSDIDVLYDIACKYEDLEKFLSDFALDPPSNKFQDQVRPLLDESEDKPLTLSTIHSSKGLEWYAVFVPHLLDGLFPSARSLKSITYLEEERRLFYVACSRAKQELYLSLPAYFSQWDYYYTMPTRFIIECAPETYRLYQKGE
ncbi:MAG: ATP-dependent helicase [Sphingobacteriales bacterium]|nr:ATP-dependent helicase [Sphingobacteriales bacterium]